MRSFLMGLLCFLSATMLQAQAELLEYRPKIIEAGFRGFSQYQNRFPEGSEQTQMLNDELLTLRLGFPIILKKKTLFGAQLKYYRQSYQTSTTQIGAASVYPYLRNADLVNAGFNALYQRRLSDDRSLSLIGVAEIASDTATWNRNSARYYVAATYNHRKSQSLELGYGLVVNYALGVLNIYPTFTYKKALSPKLMFEALLPSSVNLRYHPTEGAHFITSLQFDNWRFNISEALENQPNELTLQRADFIFSLIYEQELYDWLWMAGDVSYVNNVAYIVSLPGDRLNEPLQAYEAQNAAYFKLSLFIVPPKKLWEKVK